MFSVASSPKKPDTEVENSSYVLSALCFIIGDKFSHQKLHSLFACDM